MTVRNRCASCREPISLLWASWNSGTKIPSTVSSPYRSLAARNGSALAPFEKKRPNLPRWSRISSTLCPPASKEWRWRTSTNLEKGLEKKDFPSLPVLFCSSDQRRTNWASLIPSRFRTISRVAPSTALSTVSTIMAVPSFFLRLTCMVAMLTCPAPKRVPI